MEENYYKEAIKQAAELGNAATEKKGTFYQHILLVSVTVFAIVISLRSGGSSGSVESYLFAFSTIFLAVGMLSIAVVYRDHMWYAQQARKAFTDEALLALREKRAMKMVTGKKSARTTVLEYIGVIALIISAAGFTAYSVIGALH
ncbi:MAG: hypothetical protein LLF93_03115 [Bacteroidales bacterium]|nr:hypothetical protein [Bacteroidales bacterium]